MPKFDKIPQMRPEDFPAEKVNVETTERMLLEVQGKKGEPGDKGEEGEKGQPGEDGKDGKDGDPGTDGNDGKDGKAGDPGSPGDRGKRGFRGHKGLSGDDGEAGEKGEQGETGSSPEVDIDPLKNRVRYKRDGKWSEWQTLRGGGGGNGIRNVATDDTLTGDGRNGTPLSVNTSELEHDELKGIPGTNPHEVTLEQARAQLNQLQGDIDFNNNDIIDVKGISFKDGQEITWNANDYTVNIPTGLGPINQVGQELFVIVHNGTAEDIGDLKAIHAVAGFMGRPSVELAIADTHEGFTNRLWLTTMIIPAGEYGIATRLGRAGGNTDMWLLSDTLYLSAVDRGELVSVAPSFPNYKIQIAGVALKDATNGFLQVAIEGTKEDTIVDAWDGSFRETIEFLVTSNGVDTITGTLQQSGGGDLTMIFSDGFAMLDCTPVCTIELTAGADDEPQTNYVYIPIATKVLTISLSGYPETEHIKVAYCYAETAAKTTTGGILINQNINDHIKTTGDNGHLLHIAENIRERGTSWKDGTLGSLSTDGTDVYIANTSGHVFQLHKQVFPAHDTAVADFFRVTNHFTTPFVIESNLKTQLLDALGASLNNTSFSFVQWGVQNKSGQGSNVMVNLPTGSYNKNFPEQAVTDINNKSVYDIPSEFKSTGFLIARFTVVLSGGVWSLYDTQSLRGFVPNVAAGGGGGGSGVTEFTGLNDTPSTYIDQAGKSVRVNAAETGLEFDNNTYKVLDKTGSAYTLADDDAGLNWNNIDDAVIIPTGLTVGKSFTIFNYSDLARFITSTGVTVLGDKDENISPEGKVDITVIASNIVVIKGDTEPPLILDAYPATAAFSVSRLLNSLYTGDLILVRRDSDDTELGIGFVDGELDTASLDAFCTGANGFITTIYDQQGSGNAVQTNTSKQPKIYDSSSGVILRNGKPAGLFDGVDNFMKSTFGSTYAQPNSIFTVASSDLADTTNRKIFDGISATLRNMLHMTSGVWRYYAGSSVSTGVPVDTDQHLFTVIFKDSPDLLYLDGVEDGSGDAGSQGLSGLVLGANHSSTVEFFCGCIQENIFYNSDISADRVAIEANFNDFYKA